MAEKRVPFTTDWGTNLVRTEAWTDEDRIFVHSSQDVSEIVKRNKREFNDSCIRLNSKFERGDKWRKVASIPNIIVDQLMRTGQWDDKAYMKKWFNDADNKAFRCSGGVI
jgi:hypothetical protein